MGKLSFLEPNASRSILEVPWRVPERRLAILFQIMPLDSQESARSDPFPGQSQPREAQKAEDLLSKCLRIDIGRTTLPRASNGLQARAS